MATKLFVNLPVKDLDRSEAFFTDLGFTFFGMTDDMASVIISEHTQVMLLAEPTFAGRTRRKRRRRCRPATTEAILVLGLERRGQVDELVDKALAAGAAPAGEPQEGDGRYQRGFADLDGHHWEALCLGDTSAGAVTSADGTRSPTTGPAPGRRSSWCTARSPTGRIRSCRPVAAALSPWFTVVNYDRRGRGGSGDTAPYAVAGRSRTWPP